MIRPEVKIEQSYSSESRDLDINGSEAAALLAKYGYSNNSHQNSAPEMAANTETFEEMVARHERSKKEKKKTPNSYTFDGNNINYYSEDYRTIEDGIGIKITVVSDMKF
jgi:hypothetical protein